MAKIELTKQQIMNLGLWDKVCRFKDWDAEDAYYNGGLKPEDLIEFDDTFIRKDLTPQEKTFRRYVDLLKEKQSHEARGELEDAERIKYILSGMLHAIDLLGDVELYNRIAELDD